MVANFGYNSTNETVITYQIGKGRNFDYPLSRYCDNKTNVTEGVVTVTSATSAGVDSLHDELSLSYDFNKSLIANSNVWNQTGSKIQFC